jgi:hypothetical protein
MHGQFYRDLGRSSVDKKNPWHGYVAQAYREKLSLITAAQDQALQYALSSEEHHDATN